MTPEPEDLHRSQAVPAGDRYTVFERAEKRTAAVAAVFYLEVLWRNLMEKQLRKKRIRRIALIVTAAVCLAAVLLNLDFEYADYGKALGKEIERAEKVLQEAEPGDQKGQYDEDTIRDFKKQIEKARAVYNDKESEYEQ